MSSNKTLRLRQEAAFRQGFRCFYCGAPMWETDPQMFAADLQIPFQIVGRFRCTAEHLIAQSNGGKTNESNIVAACSYCNGFRHAKCQSMTWHEYKDYVKGKVNEGKWYWQSGYRLVASPERTALKDSPWVAVGVGAFVATAVWVGLSIQIIRTMSRRS